MGVVVSLLRYVSFVGVSSCSTDILNRVACLSKTRLEIFFYYWLNMFNCKLKTYFQTCINVKIFSKNIFFFKSDFKKTFFFASNVKNIVQLFVYMLDMYFNRRLSFAFFFSSSKIIFSNFSWHILICLGDKEKIFLSISFPSRPFSLSDVQTKLLKSVNRKFPLKECFALLLVVACKLCSH